MTPRAVITALRRDPAARALAGAARAWPQPVYFVGGTLRDAALGRRGLPDVDVAVRERAQAFAKHLARRLKGTFIVLHQQTQVYRVVVKKRGAAPWQFDVARLQGTLAEDLARRDFTVNAMALEAAAGTWHDPFGGLKDLAARRLRVTAPKVLADDPLRLLRAFRLAAVHDLRIAPATLRAIARHKHLARKPAGERLRGELVRLAAAGPLAPRLAEMDACGLLTALIPELEKQRRCAVGYYGKGGVLKHTLTVVARQDYLLARLDAVYPKYAAKIRATLAAMPGGEAHARGLLRLAALLHDVAKPATAKKIGGRLRFFQHEAVGARMAKDLLKALRFSRDEIEFVEPLVYHHLRPGNLAANRVISDKAVFRFFRDLGAKGVALLLLCWADHAAYVSAATLERILPRASEDPHRSDLRRVRGADTRKTLFHLQVVSYLLARYFERPDKVRPKRLLSGDAVMKALGVGPGPDIGRALSALAEAQAEGRVRTRREAVAFLKNGFK